MPCLARGSKPSVLRIAVDVDRDDGSPVLCDRARRLPERFSVLVDVRIPVSHLVHGAVRGGDERVR
jgi:hypothetical protein